MPSKRPFPSLPNECANCLFSKPYKNVEASVRFECIIVFAQTHRLFDSFVAVDIILVLLQILRIVHHFF